tara:strand:- start:247 stop:774 length:528 start_codon:yes stop_codon:yes gene_type:complete
MRTAIATALATVSMSAAPLAVAGDNALELRYGERGDITFHGASLRFGELWSRDAGNWKMRLQPVVEGGRFRYSGSRAERDQVSYGGLGLGFRIAHASAAIRPYFELGLGATYFDQTTLGPRGLSTRFQFTEWIGVGLEFAEYFSLGVRFSHYSNANIKRPNDGVDMQQIVVGARF